MPALAASPFPRVLILGAPGTGVQPLHAALLAHPDFPDSVQILCGEEASAHDVGLPRLLASAPGALALLMGLDLPFPAGDRAQQEAADARLRAALTQSGVAFRVVYGQGARRTDHALSAIKSIATTACSESARGPSGFKTEENPGRTGRLRAWNCEKCSDPECEHRLFTALTNRESRTS